MTSPLSKPPHAASTHITSELFPGVEALASMPARSSLEMPLQSFSRYDRPAAAGARSRRSGWRTQLARSAVFGGALALTVYGAREMHGVVSVGGVTALEWCLSGRMVDAHEALAYGLVRSVHEPQDLLPAARTLAREFVENCAPVSVALTRQMLWRMLGADHPMAAHRLDSRLIQSLGQAADAKEGLAAHLERRKPNFPCRVSSDMPEGFPPLQDEPFA